MTTIKLLMHNKSTLSFSQDTLGWPAQEIMQTNTSQKYNK